MDYQKAIASADYTSKNSSSMRLVKVQVVSRMSKREVDLNLAAPALRPSAAPREIKQKRV